MQRCHGSKFKSPSKKKIICFNNGEHSLQLNTYQEIQDLTKARCRLHPQSPGGPAPVCGHTRCCWAVGVPETRPDSVVQLCPGGRLRPLAFIWAPAASQFPGGVFYIVYLTIKKNTTTTTKSESGSPITLIIIMFQLSLSISPPLQRRPSSLRGCRLCSQDPGPSPSSLVLAQTSYLTSLSPQG